MPITLTSIFSDRCFDLLDELDEIEKMPKPRLEQNETPVNYEIRHRRWRETRENASKYKRGLLELQKKDRAIPFTFGALMYCQEPSVKD